MTARQRRTRAARETPKPAIAKPEVRKSLSVGHDVVALSRLKPAREKEAVQPFVIPEHPPGVAPDHGMAQDDALGSTQTWAANAYAGLAYSEGTIFLGYAQLAAMAQRPEYRRIVEVISTEMTRKWIRVTASGKDDKSERLAKINAALKRHNVQDLFRRATECDGFFGRAHLYVDLGTGDDAGELTTSIGTGRDETSRNKIGKGSLKGFRLVEPTWCYPGGYNTTNPLAPDWYRPSQWYVQGRPLHATRMLTFVSREVPDLLKPAYSFGGLSLTQLVKPYVENWLKTRESVSDLISSFSVSGIKVALGDILAAGTDAAAKLMRRVDLFNNLRDNRGTMVLDKGHGDNDPAEEFFNVATPLGTLDKLQAQAQEQMASIPGIPLVKFFGITPSGLNASSDGEIRVFYDGIHARQEDDYRPNLTTVIDIIQLSECGDVDPDIGFVFESLWQLSDKEKAEVAYTTAAAVSSAESNGIISTPSAMKELQRSSETTGVFGSITDEDIQGAEAEPPPPDLDDDLGGGSEADEPLKDETESSDNSAAKVSGGLRASRPRGGVAPELRMPRAP